MPGDHNKFNSDFFGKMQLGTGVHNMMVGNAHAGLFAKPSSTPGSSSKHAVPTAGSATTVENAAEQDELKKKNWSWLQRRKQSGSLRAQCVPH